MSGSVEHAGSQELELYLEVARISRGELERIAQAEDARHRRAIEQRRLELKSRGQVMGFVLALLSLIGTVLIGIGTDHWEAAIFGSVNIVPLVAIFVLWRRPVEQSQAQLGGLKGGGGPIG